MAQQIINTGAVANDGTGESLRDAFNAVNDNFSNIWAQGPVDSQVVIANNLVTTNQTNLDLVLAANGIGNVTVNSTLTPGIDSVYDLGASDAQFDTVWARYYQAGSGTFSGDVTVDGNLVVAGNIIQVGNIVTDSLTIQLGNTVTNAAGANGAGITVGANDNIATMLYSSTSNTWTMNIGANITGNVTAPYFIGNGALLTGIASTYGNANVVANLAALGSNPISTTGNVTAGYLFGNGSQLTGIATSSYANANAVAYGQAGWAGNIIPSGNAVYSLGNATNQWNDLYVSNTTIYMNNVPISLTAGNVLTVNGNAVLQNDSNTSIATTGNISAANIAVTSGSLSWPNASIVQTSASDFSITGDGQVTVRSLDGTYQWTFDTAGNLTVPNIIQGSADSDYALKLGAFPEETAAGRWLQVRSGDVADHIHFDTSNNSAWNFYVGSDNQYVLIGNTGNVSIGSYDSGTNTTYQWMFDNTGNLVIPGTIVSNSTILFDNRASGNTADIQLYSADDILLQGRDRTIGDDIEGGDINIYAGDGSPDDAGGGTGGGGDIQIIGGVGGAANVSSGGSGGTVRLDAGNGGDGSATAAAGSGATAYVSAGDGGIDNGGGGNNGGDVVITAGDTTDVAQDRGRVILNAGGGGDETSLGGYVQVSIPSVGANPGGQWTFTGSGTTLETPANAEIFGPNFGNLTVGAAGNTIITSADYGITTYNWVFDNAGGIVAPNLTVTRGDRTGTLTGSTLRIGNGSQEAILTTPNGVDGSDSQRLVINPGAGSDFGEGGDIYLYSGRGGASGGSGGDIKIRGGLGPVDGYGGYIDITGGEAAGNGAAGYIDIIGGQSANAAGGYVRIIGGQGRVGGDANITGGVSTAAPGGAVNITGGTSSNGLAEYGNVNITGGASTWRFDNAGVLTLPGEGVVRSNNDTITLESYDTANSLGYGMYIGTTGGLYFKQGTDPNWLTIIPNASNAEISSSSDLSLVSGIGTSGAAGNNISITAGAADQSDYYTTPGGNVNITGGLGATNDGGGGGRGGFVNITSGASADPAGVPGNVTINSGSSTWTFDYNNKLSSGPLSITSQFGLGTTGTILENGGTLELIGNGTGAGNTGCVVVGWNSSYGTAGNVAQMYFNPADSTGNIVVTTGNTAGTSYEWNFDKTGTLTTPGNISTDWLNIGNIGNIAVIAADVKLQITADAGNTAPYWTFNNDGTLYVPGNISGDNTAPLIVEGSGSGEGYISLPHATFGNEQVVIVNNFSLGNGIRLETNGGNLFFDNSGNLTAPDAISATGNVTGAYILGNGSGLTNLPAPTVAQDITSVGDMSLMTYDGNIKYVNYATVEPATGTIKSSGNISATGNVQAGNVKTAGLISATGNITTAGNFVGNGAALTNVTVSVAGNIIGTQSNVTLVAGSYSYTFDNTGTLTLPAPAAGNEGAEISFTKAANSTLSGNAVAIDQYVDRIRFFEGGGNTRGAYIDLTQAADGVGTLLNNRVSGIVNAGTFVTMDLLKVTVTTSGNRGLSLAATTGSFNINISGTYGGVGGSSGSAGTGTINTTPSTSQFGWNFTSQAEGSTYIITDTTNNRAYRVTLQIGGSFNNNLISIERLI